jgi:uncharacterized membrane protein YbhN (UPF0104 family)
VFLLLLCNDKAVLGPWVNGRWLNLFTGSVITVLVVLSIILTAAVLYPNISDAAILWTLGGGVVLALLVAGVVMLPRRNGRREDDGGEAVTRADRRTWRMPPLRLLEPARLTMATRIWLSVLRVYLVVASVMVVVRVTQLALGQR